jgi:predicted deacylase
MKAQSFLVGAILFASSLGFSVEADHHIATTTNIPETVVDIAVNSDAHSTLVAAVVAADLAETLSSE